MSVCLSGHLCVCHFISGSTVPVSATTPTVFKIMFETCNIVRIYTEHVKKDHRTLNYYW